MKKSKKKIAYIVGCVALSVLLGFSSYIGLVIAGVVAEEKKNSADASIQENVTNQGDVSADNNGTVVGYADNNNSYVTGNQNVNTGDNGGINSEISGGNANENATGNLNGNSNINANGNINVNGTGNNSSEVGGGNNANQNSGSVNPNAPVVNSGDNMQNSPQSNNLLDENKTAADIVSIYATVMNKAKADKPGFTKIEYQELPGDSENRVISEGDENVSEESVNKLLGFVEDLGVFVPKEKAESEPYIHEKGDEDMSLFPVFSREKGSYLTDPNGIESFTYKVLSNGNVKFSFVLVPEDNPEPIGENSDVAPSYTGAVFSPMSKERIDGTVNHPIVGVFAKNIQYSLRYHDCYVEVEFNPDTLQIVNLKQLAFVSIKGSGDVVGVGTIGLERQELYSTVIIKDMQW